MTTAFFDCPMARTVPLGPPPGRFADMVTEKETARFCNLDEELAIKT